MTEEEKQEQVKQEDAQTEQEQEDTQAEQGQQGEPMQDIDIEKEAEKLCCWGAARASVIVVTPVLGTMALMANEVYMITRLADLRGVQLEDGAIMGLLGSLGASFVGQTFFTLIPFAPLQIPVAVGVTYGVGKVANAWLRAGRPEDVAQFREIFEEARDEGLSKFKEFTKMGCKEKPLGDEKKKFNFKAEPIFNDVKGKADKAAGQVEAALGNVWEYLKPMRERSQKWLNAQKWEDISHGKLTIPYDEVHTKLAEALVGSDFTLVDFAYQAEQQLKLTVKDESHGTIALDIEIEEFTISNTKAYVRMHLVNFAILDNDFAQLIVETVGTKLIMSIVNAIFNEKVLEQEDFACVYNDSTLEVDFTQLIQNSQLVKISFLEKTVLDVVHFVALIPTTKGLLIKCSLKK